MSVFLLSTLWERLYLLDLMERIPITGIILTEPSHNLLLKYNAFDEFNVGSSNVTYTSSANIC